MALLDTQRRAVSVPHDDPAFGERGRMAAMIAHGFALSCGDPDPFANTVGRTAYAIGDTGESGERPEEGHARVPLLRLCTGSSEACWLWSLEAFLRDPAAALERVRHYYERTGVLAPSERRR